jgi:hypothetical protein
VGDKNLNNKNSIAGFKKERDKKRITLNTTIPRRKSEGVNITKQYQSQL